MKKFRMSLLLVLSAAMLLGGCSTWNKTQKGAVIGTAAGGAAGAVIGKTAGNTALGAIIGAAVGGGAGAIIGRQMDKQAEEIKKNVPDAKVDRIGEGIVVEFSSNVLFAFDDSDLSDDAKMNLGKLVSVLETYPETNIEVQGHTDSKGSVAYNQNLSEQRARVASRYLTNSGISASRLNIVGFGESLPKYANDSSVGRTQNRKVEFLITANEKMKAEAEEAASN